MSPVTLTCAVRARGAPQFDLRLALLVGQQKVESFLQIDVVEYDLDRLNEHPEWEVGAPTIAQSRQVIRRSWVVRRLW